ncbi:MAG: hypothetical protein RBT05_05525 [Bacteroidales bacterium]|jgi:hypothetical protein|nr:hypothetical protein [Bacteroidales bacterium]
MEDININLEEARKFLELLFSNHFKQHKGFIEILHRRVNQKRADNPLYFDSVSGLLDKFDMFTGDVYFGVAPREFKRGTKEAVKYFTCFGIDIDIGTEGHEAFSELITKKDAFEFIAKFELKPSIIVDSGHGLHLYWLLKDSMDDSDIAEEILKGLTKKLKGDQGKWHKNLLLRLPGTTNRKVPDEPKQVKIIGINDLKYEVKDFEQYRVIGLEEFEGEIIFDKGAPIFTIENLTTSKIAPEILNLIRDGDTKGKHMKTDERTGELRVDKSERDQAIILELLKTGHKPEAIRGIFSNSNYPISDRYLKEGKRGDYYLSLSIKNAQKFLDSGVIEERQKKNLIVPKEPDSIFRNAILPELPLMIEKNGQQLFTFVYDNPLTNTKVRADTNKEILKEFNLTEDDLKYREMTWEGSIANYLMDKKARTGLEEISGSVEDIVKFLFPKPRQEDYKKVEVNLKSLAVRQYIVKHDRQDVVFMVLNPFKFNETSKTFTAGLSVLVPKIVGEVLGGEKETLYINKTKKEYYPKQGKYNYNIRNYFASIKHITKDIPTIKGITLLERSGYLADVNLGRKKYRNSEAQKIIDKYTKIGLKEYRLIVNCYKQDLQLKDVREKTFYIKVSDRRRFIRQDPDFLDTLAKFIYNQPGDHNLQICINRAKGLFNQYGVEAVKKAYLKNCKKESFRIAELETILSDELKVIS